MASYLRSGARRTYVGGFQIGGLRVVGDSPMTAAPMQLAEGKYDRRGSELNSWQLTSNN